MSSTFNEMHFDPTEKRIGLVYNSEFSGYQAFDFSKVDDIESLLRNTSSAVSADAFGRARVSEPYTLADYSHVYGEDTEILSKTSGNASSVTFDINKAKAILTIGTGVNDYVIHQSRMHHHYMPGKSQVTLQSFNFTGERSGTNKRIGLFNDYNGIFFQLSGDGTKQIVLRSDVSGSINDEVINQTNWNIDTCNGSGLSNFNLNLANTQLFYADFQWLGVGRLRAGFVHDGKMIVAHEFYNSNNKPSVYWSNPNLPIRCELRNYASGAGSTATSDQICATVLSEGGYAEAGIDFAAKSNIITIQPGATSGILAIRLKTGYNGKPNRSIVRLNKSNILSQNENATYEVWRLPSTGYISGGTWVSANNESVVEYNTTASGYNTTSGIMFDAGLIIAGGLGAGQYGTSAFNTSISAAKRGYIAQNIDSTDSNVFAIKMTNLNSSINRTTDTFASLQWRETR